jgi:hypothetical protein
MGGWNLNTPHRRSRMAWTFNSNERPPPTPVSVGAMIGCYNATQWKKTPHRPRVDSYTRTCTHADGTVLRCAYHWAEAQGYVRTPFHGGRIAGWKLVNSLTKIPIKSTDRGVGGPLKLDFNP